MVVVDVLVGEAEPMADLMQHDRLPGLTRRSGHRGPGRIARLAAGPAALGAVDQDQAQRTAADEGLQELSGEFAVAIEQAAVDALAVVGVEQAVPSVRGPVEKLESHRPGELRER